MFRWFKRKNSPIEGASKELEDADLDYLDSVTGEPMISDKPSLRRPIDLSLFAKIQRALVLKNSKKFYRTEEQIARKFKIGTTTVSLIRRATETKRNVQTQFKYYKELRRRQSKPQQYQIDN